MTGLIRKLENTRVLEAQGCIMGPDMMAVMRVIRELFAEADHVVLDLERVPYADTALFQTICCLHQQARDQGKTLSVSGAVPEPLNRMLRIAGLAENDACRYCAEGLCAWRDRIVLKRVASL